jgi:hypothetical protein
MGKYFHSNRGGASVAFLLLLLPNLIDLILDLQSPPTYVTEFMRLYTSEDAQHPFPPVQLTAVFEDQTHSVRFPQLSTLRFATESYVAVDFGPILRLNSLWTFRVGALSTGTWNIPPGISSVHELEAKNCKMDESNILPMPEACNELRKFAFSWDQPWSDEDVVDEEWDFGIEVAPWIIRGLQRSKATLEVLELSGKHPLRRDTMSLGSLTDFDHLLTLHVPAAMIIDPDSSSSGRRTLNMFLISLRHLHLFAGRRYKRNDIVNRNF